MRDEPGSERVAPPAVVEPGTVTSYVERPRPESGTGAAPGRATAGLLRDVQIQVAPAPGALPPRRERDGAGTRAGVDESLAERWRELGARLRATHPPTIQTFEDDGGRTEAAAVASFEFGDIGSRPSGRASVASGDEVSRAPHEGAPELVIRNLEIRIVAAPKEARPAPKQRSPAADAGAWATAARCYLGKL